MKVTFLSALLLLCATPALAGTSAADSAARRIHDALGVKARLEKTVADKIAATGGPGAATDSGTHAPAGAAHGRAGRGTPAAPSAAHATPANDATGDVWTDLLAGNRRFIGGRPRVRALVDARATLAHGQHPRAIVLACADSRVGPELLFDQSLGDLFVVRVAGNVADSLGVGSIEYAVEHLHATFIVVLGHTACGAVTAAASGGDPVSPNIAALVARITPVIRRLSGCFEGEELVERAVLANTRQSADDLLLHSALLRHAQKSAGLRVVAAVYDLETGVVKALK